MTLNELLVPVSHPLSQFLHLPRLPAHFDTIVLSFLGFHVIQWTSPFVFARWFPEHYGKASRRVQQGWASHACSMFHAVTVVVLAARCLALPELNTDRVWGTHPREGEMAAFACGFIWDTLEETVVHFQDVGLALHGILVLMGIALTFRPWFAYVCVRLLLLEISTPFLNIHWFLDKTGRTGTTLQMMNGVALIVVFFLARICYGTMTAYTFMSTLYEARGALPPFLTFLYAFGTISLQILNYFWMYKMLGALRKRFPAQARNLKNE